MQKARRLDLAFPSRSASQRFAPSDRTGSGRHSSERARFERLLIVLLCTLWGIGVLLWALVSLVSLGGHGTASTLQAVAKAPLPSSMPTLQTAAAFAIRVMFAGE